MSVRSEKGDGEQPPMPAQEGAVPKPSVKPPPPLPPSKPVASRPPPVPAARTNPPPPVAPRRDGASTAPPQHAQTPEARLHVFVKTSVRDPNLLIVRPLAEGQRPPAGTREAFLVLVEPESSPNTSNGGHA
jgi:hypothetical protein